MRPGPFLDPGVRPVAGEAIVLAPADVPPAAQAMGVRSI
jgi:hypothetical protein